MPDSVATNPFLPRVENLRMTLLWSISFDAGVTFSAFAVTQNQVFLVLDAFIENDPERPVVATAKRVDYVTSAEVALGAWDKDEAVLRVTTSIPRRPGTGVEAGGSPVYLWRAVDQWGPVLDCLVSAELAVLQLYLLGVRTQTDIAYPTGHNPPGDTVATSGEGVWQSGPDQEPSEALIFREPGSPFLNFYEGYLRYVDRSPLTAYIVYPLISSVPRTFPNDAQVADVVSASQDNRLSYRVLQVTLFAAGAVQQYLKFPENSVIATVPLPVQ